MSQIYTPQKFNEVVQAQARAEAQSLLDEVQGVRAVVIATVDGFSIAHAARSDLDASRIAALASSIAAIGQVAADEANLGRSKCMIVDTTTGFVSIYSTQFRTIDLILMIVADSDALIAQVNYRANAVIKRLTKL